MPTAHTVRQDDLGIAEARRRWSVPGKIFGLSTHNEAQRNPWDAGELAPDYIGVGPVFPTPTKERPDAPLGTERMGRIVRNSPLTAVAIGGIDADNLAEVLRQGAANFCVVRAVNREADPGCGYPPASGDLEPRRFTASSWCRRTLSRFPRSFLGRF